MKKTVCFIVATLTAMLIIISSAALSYDDIMTAVSNEAEAANVISDMDANGLVSASDITSAYKAYRLGAHDLAALAKQRSSDIDLSDHDVYWHLISDDGSDTLLKNNDNKWTAVGKSVSQNNTDKVMSADPTAKAAQINAGFAGLDADASFIACIEVPDYHTTFLLFSEQGELGVMPFGSRPDLTKLENGEVYTLDKALDILSESMPLSPADDDIYGGAAGDTAAPHNSIILPAIIISAVILVIVASFWAVMTARSRKKRAQAAI